MIIKHLKEGMELYYADENKNVAKCTLEKRQKRNVYVSFLNKKGKLVHKFLDIKTIFFDNCDETMLKIKKDELKSIEHSKQLEKEIEDNKNKMIELIENSENINQLPVYDDFCDLSENIDVGELIGNNLDGEIIEIKDGTKIELSMYYGQCFNNRDHGYFYKVIDEDLVICIDCGLMQCGYNEIKKQVGYEDDWIFGEKLLPRAWNINDVTSYFKKFK